MDFAFSDGAVAAESDVDRAVDLFIMDDAADECFVLRIDS